MMTMMLLMMVSCYIRWRLRLKIVLWKAGNCLIFECFNQRDWIDPSRIDLPAEVDALFTKQIKNIENISIEISLWHSWKMLIAKVGFFLVCNGISPPLQVCHGPSTVKFIFAHFSGIRALCTKSRLPQIYAHSKYYFYFFSLSAVTVVSMKSTWKTHGKYCWPYFLCERQEVDFTSTARGGLQWPHKSIIACCVVVVGAFVVVFSFHTTISLPPHSK